ncbi:MAG: hypothetical protein GY937_27005 [bacterium]|nr:hypothetical protein [bacterium]
MGHDRSMNSRVHPKYKTKYRVNNCAEYDRALVQRGNITLWISEDAISTWKPAPTGLRGGQRKFSDQAIETALVLPLSANADETLDPSRITVGRCKVTHDDQRLEHSASAGPGAGGGA